MSKYVFTDGYVSIAGTAFSSYAFSIDTPDEKEQVDVSGFSPTQAKEFLPGQRDQTVTIQFLQDFIDTTNGPHAKLTALYEANSSFALLVAPTSGTVSATNPQYGGTVTLYSYNGLSGQLNSRGEITATFRPNNGSTALSWRTA